MKPNLTRIASVSIYNNAKKTPDKIKNFYQKDPGRSRSGTELVGTSDYKKRSKQNESFISSIPGYVDYSEIIHD